MITLAITGGYATGKTVVANIFKKLGAEVIYADSIAHNCMRPNTSVWKEVVRYFGKGILKKDGQIDRGKLAKIVFSDNSKLTKLNKLVHPSVREKLKKIIQDRYSKGKTEVLAVEIPLLFEAGLESWFTKTLVVACKKDVQYWRIKRRDRIPRKEILQRVKSQWPLAKKKKMADFVVDNSGSMAETRRQVVEIWEKLMGTTEITE